MAQLYVYDGSFEGFLTSIFHAYPMNPEQVDFCQEEQYCCSFFQPVMVNTEIQLAERVSNGIRRYPDEDSLTTVYQHGLPTWRGLNPQSSAFSNVLLLKGAVSVDFGRIQRFFQS